MIFGHKKQLSLLKSAVQNNSLPQSLIFYGEEGIGKKTIAVNLAEYILCGENKEFSGKENQECHKLFLSEAYPDFLFIKPEEGAKEIKIKQARKIVEFTSLLPQYSNSKKVAIVDEAEKLSIDSQNTLLKTLEEPKDGIFFILITSNIERIISTIRSRCQILRFYPLEAKKIKEIVELYLGKNEWPEENYFFFQGRPGKAIKIAEKEKAAEKFDNYLRQVKNFSKNSFFNKMLFSEKMFKRKIFPEKLMQFLDSLELYWQFSLIKSSERNELEKIYTSKNNLELIFEAKQLLKTTTVSPRIIFDNLLMELDSNKKLNQ